MSYEHRSKVKSQQIPLTVKVIGSVSIFLVCSYLFFPRLLPSIFTFIASPFWTIETESKQQEILYPQELQNATISELKKENDELKSILDHASSTKKLSISYILKKPPFSAYDTYIIDVSNSTNAQKGDKVYAVGNVLLGEIVEKNGSFAKVKLYSSYGEKYNVTIGKNNIQATAIGNGGGSFELTLPRDVKIFENDIVIVPDLNSAIFGVVRSITIDPVRSFAKVLFSQPINLYEQKWVIIHTQ